MVKLNCFVQRDAEHVVERFKAVFVVVEYFRLLLRKPRAPILANRRAAGWKGAAVVYHERSPKEQVAKYIKSVCTNNTSFDEQQGAPLHS